MKVEFLKKFSKDLGSITQTKDKRLILEVINLIKESDNFKDIPNTKKLVGFKNAYRIRSGNLRIGIFLENSLVQFARVAYRKDIYNLFP